MSNNVELPPGLLNSSDSEDAEPGGADRRERDRETYRHLQKIAPCTNGEWPDPSAFHSVRCHDLSRGGVSFYTDKPPLDEFLIIALGREPDVSYLKVRVANCIRVGESQGATFRVGCEFLTRIELPADGEKK